MRWKKILIILVLVIALVFLVYFFYFRNTEKNKDFELSSFLIKTVIKEDGVYNGKLKIENLQDYKKHFEISFQGVNDFATLNPKSFDLEAKEKKYLELNISNPNKLSDGIYVGSMKILSDKNTKIIPAIIEIESKDVLFDSNLEIYPAGAISPGEEINAEIKIFDLSRVGKSNVLLKYFVRDFEGTEIFAEEESIIVDNQVLITKPISLPDDIREKEYVIGVVLKYKNAVGTSSASFSVSKEKWFADTNTLYMLAAMAFVFLLFLISIFYSMYSRDKLLKEIRKQYKKELRKQEVCLSRKEKEVSRKLKTSQEKKVAKELFYKVRRKRKEELEKIKKQRVEKIKKLRKRKRKDLIKKQIMQWEKQGYDTSVLERKIKVPTEEDIRRRIRIWKKKGYNTEILEKKKE